MTDYPCVILRHARLGHLCGYVRIPADHPWQGLTHDSRVEQMWCDVELHRSPPYIAMLLEAVDGESREGRVPISIALQIHGGCSFARQIDGDWGMLPVEPGWWFGFDCGHAGDQSPGTRRFGWPMFFSDTYCDLEYVVGECQSLASQLYQRA